MNGYYSIGGAGLGLSFPSSFTSSAVQSATQSAASLKTSANASEKADIKRGIQNVGIAQVKANKNGWPFADFVIDQVNSEMGSGSSGGGGFLDTLQKTLTFAAPLAQTGLAIKAGQDAAKDAKRRQASIPNYQPQYQQPQVIMQQPSGTPGWVLPVAIIGGLGILGLGLVIALK